MTTEERADRIYSIRVWVRLNPDLAIARSVGWLLKEVKKLEVEEQNANDST